MSETVRRFEQQSEYVAAWTARLDTRDVLVPAIQAALPSGTLEVVNPRTGSPTTASIWLENRVNAERALWQARIVGTEPGEVVGVEDLRDLAGELGVPVPALVRK